MRGKIAKRLRKLIYGIDYAHKPSSRKYRHVIETGQIVSDERRRAYQVLKRAWKERLRP